MGLFDFMRKAPQQQVQGVVVEARGDNPGIPVSSGNAMQIFGLESVSVGEPVSVASALRVPAFAAGVNFIAGTMAGLPLGVYRKTAKGRVEDTSDVGQLLATAVNPGMSKFEFIRWLYETQLTLGRAIAFIERDAAGRCISLWPLDPLATEVFRQDGRKRFRYRENGRTLIYEAAEVFDLPFMLAEDGLTHRSPVDMGRDILRLALEMTTYGARLFRNGGVPPFAVQGNFQTPAAMERAGENMETAVRTAAQKSRLALVMPAGVTVEKLADDADKMQMIEAKRFLIEEIARLLGLPPVFLQDFSHAALANVEQQDIHLSKHLIKRYAEQFEAEANLKLFGWKNRTRYVEFSMDGLLRGDFKSRSEANARAIMTGQRTPDEVRAMDNLQKMPGGDVLYMQGAMVPLGDLAKGRKPVGDAGAGAPDLGMSDGGDNGA